MYLTTQGLVLRVSPYNETDAMLTILTARHGKISAKARGLRRKNSPLIAPCQLLSFSEFTFFEHKEQFTVNEAHSVELFIELRKDLCKLSLGTYFAQVADLISQEDLPNPELLSLVLNCLYALSKNNTTESKAKAAFELRAACLAGYTPDLSGCAFCGSHSPQFFNVAQGHLECASCETAYDNNLRMPVSAGMLDAMRYITLCDSKKILSFTLQEDTMLRLSQLTELYLIRQLERGFSTLDFYKSLQIEAERSC